MSARTVTPLAYTRDEAAEALRMSKAKVDQAIRLGDLKAKRNGRDILIPAKALDAYLESLQDA
jgi:excisionase family DNA binding protein